MKMPYEAKRDFIFATALDPRFKLSWCSGESFQENKASLLKEARKNQLSNGREQETVEQPSKLQKCGDLLDMSLQEPDHVAIPASPVEEELDKYLGEPRLEQRMHPLTYWQTKENSFPHLAEMAKKYLSLPASSAAVECLFSIGGKIFRPERCRLTDSVFEQLMFIRCNLHLLN